MFGSKYKLKDFIICQIKAIDCPKHLKHLYNGCKTYFWYDIIVVDKYVDVAYQSKRCLEFHINEKMKRTSKNKI